MAEFAQFDRRGYRTVDVRHGYGEWVATYEATVQDAMDLALLDGIRTVDWAAAATVADLGCGTGRTAAWLRERGAGAIDGVDVTPEMLDRARARGAHRRLIEGDVTRTGLDAGAYDLVICALVDEHLPALAPLYAEAHRLARPGGAFVIVGFHPHFIMASGMPTHYDDAAGEPVAIETYVHQLSDHVAAALDAGWSVAEMREQLIDDAWLALKPKWSALRGQPVSYAFGFRRS